MSADPSAVGNQRKPLRLLLHTVDGAVPFLTPTLLQKCFPPDKYPSLMLGIAVRDVCAKQEQRCNGFTEDAAVIDPWLLVYLRVTVPTFDMASDEATFNKSKSAKPQVHKKKVYNESSGSIPKKRKLDHAKELAVKSIDDQVEASSSNRNVTEIKATKSTADVVKNQEKAPHIRQIAVNTKHLPLWTSNGRQNLTPETYNKAAIKLKSSYTVPLFDQVYILDQSNALVDNSSIDGKSVMNINKRMRAALEKTRVWFDTWKYHVSRTVNNNSDQSTTSVTTTLVPIVVEPKFICTDSWDMIYQQQFDHVHQLLHGDFASNISGIVFVGGMSDGNKSNNCVYTTPQYQSLQQSSIYRNLDTCLLTANSLTSLLDAAKHGVNTIGTDLPTQWARNMKAFVLTLPCNNKITTMSEAGSSHKTNIKHEHLDHNGCIDLQAKPDTAVNAHSWFNDKQAICSECTCLTCQTHSRSYIYHLVCAKELLAETLLFIHNLTHLLRLVKLLDTTCSESDRKMLYDSITSQLV